MYELITGVSMHIPNLYRDNSSFPYAPHLCRDSNLCQDKSQNHINIFQIYIGAFYLFRDRISAILRPRPSRPGPRAPHKRGPPTFQCLSRVE